MKKVISILLTLCILGAAGYFGWQAYQKYIAKPEDSSSAALMTPYTIARGNLSKTVTGTGTLSISQTENVALDYGVTVTEALAEEEIRKSGIHFTYDEHGHPELGKVSKAHIFNEMIEMKLKELGLKVKSRPVELGYEIRCQTPIAYDLTYCSELGIGVHKLFAEGKTGCMVYVDSEGNVSPLYLKDLQDPTTGKIPPRLVDIKSDKFTSVVETILNAITPADYEAAKAYVPNPEEYDFHKILNWK